MSDSDADLLVWSAPETLPSLSAGEIHIFAFPLNAPPPGLADFEALLTRAEADRAARFKHDRDRRRYVVGRAQLRKILGRYLGTEAKALEFRYGTHGKPALSGPACHERLHFNMTRSDELGAVALRLDVDLGIDLERIRPLPDALDIAKRHFAREEYEALCARPDAFFSYWTRKEAVVKSSGLGLSHPMAAIALQPRPTGAGERVTVRDADRDCWVVLLPPPTRTYVAAVATPGPPCALRCWAWNDPPAPRQW